MSPRKFEFSSTDRAYPETEGKHRPTIDLGGRGDIVTTGATGGLDPETERKAALAIIHNMAHKPRHTKKEVLQALGLIKPKHEEGEIHEAA